MLQSFGVAVLQCCGQSQNGETKKWVWSLNLFLTLILSPALLKLELVLNPFRDLLSEACRFQNFRLAGEEQVFQNSQSSRLLSSPGFAEHFFGDEEKGI